MCLCQKVNPRFLLNLPSVFFVATLSKMIRELVPGDLRVRPESLDMLIDCCTGIVSRLDLLSCYLDV